ncbi:MAG: hypothetical protein ACE5JN_16450 [Candidatus Methylomirabilia bacterium]
MRTTVVLKDNLVSQAKKFSSEKTLSGLLNQCLQAWVRQHSLRDLEVRLAKEYKEGGRESRNVARDFADLDKENWPSW